MKFSINLTVHNKVFLLPAVLDSIAKNTSGMYELVVCFDGCTDGSKDVFNSFKPCFPRFTITADQDNIFETRANNITARHSRGEYIIFLQDDMVIDECGWNERIIKPLEAWSDVFAVTARTAHSWMANPESKDIYSDEIRDDRWCDILAHFDHADRTNTRRGEFAIRQSVNRGPLAFRRSEFDAMGGFDEAYAPLQFDEHDLMFRANRAGWVCGFYDVGWHSRPEWGGTRGADGATRPFMYEADHKNSRLFYSRHFEALIGEKMHNETRFLE